MPVRRFQLNLRLTSIPDLHHGLLDADQEDPYEIFESLNFKGTDLTPADLVRNFVLMRYKHSLGEHGDQTRIYNEYWRPIESNCGNDLPQFLPALLPSQRH